MNAMLDAGAPKLQLATETWDHDADEILVCQAVRQETHDVKTFVLKPLEPRRFSYQPGQFMTYSFEIGGETIQRCYTISAAPTRPDTISLTVKRVPNGPVSNWLHDTMRPGMRLRALGPMGHFTCFAHPARRYLMLSGGSGITPLMSMARTFHDLAEPRDVVFIHSARTSADIIFHDELTAMARRDSTFRFAAVVEAATPLSPWDGLRGRLSLPMLNVIAPDFMEREIFICGPAPYMAAVRAMLEAAGFDMKRYFQESFDFGELTRDVKAEASVPDTPGDSVKTFKVEFTRTRRSVDVPETMTILEAAKRAGMRLPSSCTEGMCGTCKSKKISGTVSMSHQGGIRQREIDAGMVLLCCSKPTSDLVIER